MKLTYFMVAAYISCCVCIRAKPCKYFQLNAAFFDRDKGIFSKQDINDLMPSRWRLAQFYDDGVRQPARFPVFVKPEWGQNASGVRRADNAADLARIRAELAADHAAQADHRPRLAYLIQEAAAQPYEYEIFSMRSHRDAARYAVLTLTRAENSRQALPINGIHNPDTRYVEITAELSPSQREKIWALVRQIGDFNISRVSARAASLAALLRGDFHIIEVNLFLPMPINFLDRRHSRVALARLAMAYMMRLALLTKHRDLGRAAKPVFTKSLLYNRRGKWLNFLRARL